jgi:hypothetical protein
VVASYRCLAGASGSSTSSEAGSAWGSISTSTTLFLTLEKSEKIPLFLLELSDYCLCIKTFSRLQIELVW